ncbi:MULTISPECIES: FtsB/FtsL family cell division protein [Pseudomonas aeruginosa group]|uniref:hypothetical protein n=1 Tax=Pseudomonas aeruginosa group TaxID=136841 RepID=UPI001F09B711|nr:hypothetical protein [Pseudomonas aeruginosa]
MSNELTDVRCPCGDEYPADSYDAGFIAGSGMCQNCDAAMPPKDIPAPVEQAGWDERDFQAKGAQEVPSPVSKEYDRHLISLLRKGEALPGHQEEAADEIERLRDWNDHLNNTVLPNILNPNFLMLMKGGERLLDLCTKDGEFIGVSLNDMKDLFDWMVTHARIAPDQAALAQPSAALPPFAEKVLAKLRRFYDCAEDFESGGVDIGRHWLDLLTQLGLLNRVQRSPALWEISQQGEDLLGMPQPSPAPELPERGTQHRFGTNEQSCRHDFAGVWWNDNGETKTGRECRHCGFFVADVAEQAEAERPEVFGLERYRVEKTGQGFWPYCVRAGDGTRELFVGHLKQCKRVAAQLATAFEDGKFIAQHESIVGGLRAEITQLRQHKNDYMDAGQETYRALQNEIREREAEIARLDGLVSGRTAERDAALARVAELERGKVYVEARQCDECQHGGINDSATGVAACHECDWTGPEPEEDRCPGCQRENCMAAACPQCGARYVLVASEEIAAPVAQAQHCVPELLVRAEDFVSGKEVPQAWLDVQAERRRQITAEGWTPEHDDEHDNGEMARAAACYALAGSSAPNDGTAALLVSLAWPWDQQWWKPTSARRDLVKACALALAEIERLDRAAPGKEGV